MPKQTDHDAARAKLQTWLQEDAQLPKQADAQEQRKPATHSPLPWSETSVGNVQDAHGYIAAYTDHQTPASTYANADLICKAVNAHADLVAALSSLAGRCEDVADAMSADPNYHIDAAHFLRKSAERARAALSKVDAE